MCMFHAFVIKVKSYSYSAYTMYINIYIKILLLNICARREIHFE